MQRSILGMTQHYDVAVIGGQPAGIIAAALLAKRGRRVLWVDNAEDGHTYRHQGFYLPLVPSLVPNLDNAPAAQRVFDELGLGPELRSVAHPASQSFQAVMPNHRLDVAPELPALLTELGIEFPDVRPALETFFERLFAIDDEISAFFAEHIPLAPARMGERWRAKRLQSQLDHLSVPFEEEAWLANIPENHPLRELLLGPLYFFGHLAAEQPSTLQAVRLIARYFRGVLEFSDTLGGLAAFMQRAAHSAGVEVHRDAEVTHIETDGRRIKQLELASERMPLTADYFIASTLGPFHTLLPPGAHTAHLAAEEEGVRATYSLLVMNLVVHRDVLPKGMGKALFLLNGRRQARDETPADPPAFLQRYPAQRGEVGSTRGKQSVVDEEHEVLCAACPVRTSEVVHSPERLRSLRTQLVARVGRVVPFLNDFLRDTSLPADPSTWDVEAQGAPRRIDPWRLHPLFTPGEPPFLGVAGRSPHTYYKNLLHCGREVLPGLGIEGEYMSGLAAADLLAKLAGKKWDTKPI